MNPVFLASTMADDLDILHERLRLASKLMKQPLAPNTAARYAQASRELRHIERVARQAAEDLMELAANVE